MKVRDKVVLVTGASRGIGAAVARQAAGRGARVGLLARTASDLEALRGELGDRCAVATADVAVATQVDDAVANIAGALGPVDVVVNNAGIGLYGAFLDADVEALDRVMRINYLGTVHVLKAVLPQMVERRSGHVVTVASIAGRIGSPFEAGYAASKFAVIGLSEALSVELAAFDIGVSLVNPGPVDTDFFDARGVPYARSSPKPVSADRVARAVLDAVEHSRPEVYVTGWLRQAVVAKTLLPPLFRWGTARAFKSELAEERRR